MRRTMLICALSLTATGFLLPGIAGADPGHGKGKDHDRFKAQLRASDEVPFVVSEASGELTLQINEAAGSIAYELSYEDLEGSVTQAHIHIGQKFVAGGIAIWLCKNSSTTPPTVPTNPAVAAITPECPTTNPATVSGTVGAANVIGPTGQAVPASAINDVITAIRAGKAYGNVHSTSAPGGEVRGQLH